jgi:hypothetical protein
MEELRTEPTDGDSPGKAVDPAEAEDLGEAEGPAEAEIPGIPEIPGLADDPELMEALRKLKVRRDRSRDLTIGIGCGVLGLVVGLIIGNTTAGSGGAASAAASPISAASRGGLADGSTQNPDTPGGSTDPSVPTTDAGVVTFAVTGHASGGVLITYGTNSTGSQSTKLPFSESMPLDSSGGVLYYDVYAQLHGSGDLTCSVAVNGKVIKTGTATTNSDICSAQIAQDAGTGQWQSE